MIVRTNPPPTEHRQRGLSLLEMMVAMVILALTLGALYQATAGATRNVRVDEHYNYATLLAESLLAEHPQVSPGGVQRSGETNDFHWQLHSERHFDDETSGIRLQRVTVEVDWNDGGKDRQVRLVTVVPELAEEMGNDG